MKEKTRNVMVGLTVLVGLVLLGGMIVIFRELPAFLRLGYDVKVRFGDTYGVVPGADVLMSGKRIGRVAEVNFADRSDPRKGIIFVCTIDGDIPIPGIANVYVKSGFMGGSALHFRLDRKEPHRDPRTSQPLAWLPRDGSITIEGAFEEGGGDAAAIPDLLKGMREGLAMIPDLREAMGSLKRLADTMNGFFAPPEPATQTSTAPGGPEVPGGPGHPSRPATANIYVTMAKLDGALDAIQKVLGDPENQANLKTALARFKDAAAAMESAMKSVNSLVASAQETMRSLQDTAGSTAGKFQELASRLIDNSDRLGKLLTTLHQAAGKIESGDGTAGKLLNDPALYNNLTDAASQLKATVAKLQDLLIEWDKKGIPFRLK